MKWFLNISKIDVSTLEHPPVNAINSGDQVIENPDDVNRVAKIVFETLLSRQETEFERSEGAKNH